MSFEQPQDPARSQVRLWVVESQDDDGNWCHEPHRVSDSFTYGEQNLETMRNVYPATNFRLTMYVPDDK